MHINLGVQTILLIVACILFGLAAFGVNSGRVNLGWLGLLFFAAAFLFG